MVYYCTTTDIGSRLGLNSAQRTQASSKLTRAIRRASIDIDQEFRDYGRNAPSREQGESTTSGAVNVEDTTIGVVNAGDFATSGSGSIDGDSFKWTAKDGGVSSLTIAAAGDNYQAGTLSATGGTGSGFTGTYGISATVASISLGGSNQNARDQSGGLHGPGTFTLNGATGGTFTVADGVISNIQITNTTKFTSVPTIAASNSTSFGDNTLTPVLSSTGVISSVNITAAGVYTVAPTAIAISHSGNGEGSITPTFTFTRLTGVSEISFDHASGVSIQDSEMAHVLREICADLAAAYYMEDEGTFFVDGESIRGNTMRARGTSNLRRLAHLGSVD